MGINDNELGNYPRIAEIPFTSERKRHTTIHSHGSDQALIFMKGAPEVLLERCSTVLVGGNEVALDDGRRAELVDRAGDLASQALRTLAIAVREASLQQVSVAEKQNALESFESNLMLLGIVGMIDPPRVEVKAAVATAKAAHIRTIMITGDHPATAAAIARELDIMEPGTRLLTGTDLRAMKEGDLGKVVEDVRVFARVDPEHKLRIVEALQRKGHIVAMTGDGINDAPALKAANIGVAMGITGTDVSKEAADMVLADDNYASIVKAIEEGRGIFDNIRKYLLYLLSSNSGELLTMFAGVTFAGLLGLTSAHPGLFLPLLAAQLLWINLVTDGPPALALGVEPRDPHAMRRPPRRHGTGVLSTADWLQIAGVGVVMMLGTMAVLDAYYPGGLFTLVSTQAVPNIADETYARTMAFTTLMMFQIFNVYNCRSSHQSAFRGLFENQWLTGAVLLSIVMQVLVVHVPFLQSAFHTTDLRFIDWIVATAVGAVLLAVMELVKAVLRARL